MTSTGPDRLHHEFVGYPAEPDDILDPQLRGQTLQNTIDRAVAVDETALPHEQTVAATGRSAPRRPNLQDFAEAAAELEDVIEGMRRLVGPKLLTH